MSPRLIACTTLALGLLEAGCSRFDQDGTRAKGPSEQKLTLASAEVVASKSASRQDVSAISQWCGRAVGVAAARSETHVGQLEALCNADGSPKSRFGDLVAKPYEGQGTPAPVALAPVASRNGSVTYFFGIAIKTPIKAAKEFNQVLINQGDVDNEKGLIRFQGANPVAVAISPVASDGDSHWTRGWQIDETSVQRVVIVDVRTSYAFRADQYDLGEDNYLYLSTIGTSRETMKDYQVMMGGLDVDGVGYVMMVGSITVDAHGYPGIAVKTLQAQVQKSIQYVYKNASAAVDK